MSIFSSHKDNKDSHNPASNAPTPAPVSTPASTPSYASATTSSSKPMTSIADGTVLDGQIRIEGDIKIEGTIKGTVTSKGRVIISASGKVDGDIICHSAEIGGHVGGKLKVADMLVLKGNAIIDGDINTGKLVIENGVKFNGNCAMGTPVVSRSEPAAKAPNKVELNAK
ncbi:MAG: hypothetical protein RIQ62_418 [Bacteroidota bacterium]|jgi:cytoskeletal protein CcmA (bactofilin family)